MLPFVAANHMLRREHKTYPNKNNTIHDCVSVLIGIVFRCAPSRNPF